MRNMFSKQYAQGIGFIVLCVGAVIFFDFAMGAENLVGGWNFDEGSGSSVSDSSGNGNNGTVIGATWTAGKVNGALNFDGNDDVVRINNPDSINNIDKLSFAAWLFVDVAQNNDRIVEKVSAWQVHMDSAGDLRFEAKRWGTDGKWTMDIPAGDPLTNGWHHIAVTYDHGSPSNNPLFYYDGVAVSANETQAPGGSLANETGTLYIGNDANNGNGRDFDGKIDEVVVHNSILSASEIAELASGSPTPPPLSDGSISGWAWSGTIGWISFNSQDCDSNSDGFVDLACGGNPAVDTTTGVNWVQEVPTGSIWSAREDHGAVVFNGRIWVMGGNQGNDVWSSADGVTWDSLGNAPWAEREDFGLVVYNNKMWVLGGQKGNSIRYNDVWSSVNGITWIEVRPDGDTSGWSQRNDAVFLVFDDGTGEKLWAMGGKDGANNELSDVWSSTDGVTWTKKTDNAGWPARENASGTVFNGRMWIMGGGQNDLNDVWSSANGITWTSLGNADWAKRDGHAVEVFEGKMWVMGGQGSSGSFSDVWSSPDGANWNLVTNVADWGVRDDHASVIFNNNIWIFGGETASGNSENDIWISPPPGPIPISEYGAEIDNDTGEFSGYAWSEHIGWISFNRADTGAPPESPYDGGGSFIAKVDFDTKEVSGWMRAISVCPPSSCDTDDNEAGWDGWIKLRDSNYGVSWDMNAGSLGGWAWGSDVVGWVDFSDVWVSLGGSPIAGITCSETPCETWLQQGSLDPILTLTNTSSDPDDDIVESRWSGITSVACPPLSPILCPYTVQINTPGSYVVSLEVEDSGGRISDPVATQTVRIFRDIEPDFKCSLDGINFGDCAALILPATVTIYVRDISTPSEGGSAIISWDWVFDPDGNPVTDSGNATSATAFAAAGAKTLSLTVVDDAGRSGTAVKTLNAVLPFPGWREISPF